MWDILCAFSASCEYFFGRKHSTTDSFFVRGGVLFVCEFCHLCREKFMKIQATALPAEITFGSWGRALWVTAANANDGKDDTVVTDVHQSWGGAAPRTALGIAGNSDNVGFKLDIHANGTGLGVGDNALIWVKPIDMVRLSVGKHDENVLRGDAAFGLWNWDRIGAVDGQEGWTFLDYLDGEGVTAVITPMEALTLGVHLPTSLDGSHTSPLVTNDKNEVESDLYTTGSLEDAWLNSAIAAGYNIEGVGTVKVGLKLNHGLGTITKDDNGNITYASYYKDKDGKDVETWCQIAAAFDLTAVENLFVSVGARINTLDTVAHEVNAYARFAATEQLAIHAIVGSKINANDGKDYKKDYDALGFTAGAGVDFALDGGLGLFADLRYANGIWKSGTSADNSDTFTLGAGVTKGFSNGVIGIAFEGTTNNKGRYGLKDADAFAWEIPVKFEYWF